MLPPRQDVVTVHCTCRPRVCTDCQCHENGSGWDSAMVRPHPLEKGRANQGAERLFSKLFSRMNSASVDHNTTSRRPCSDNNGNSQVRAPSYPAHTTPCHTPGPYNELLENTSARKRL